MLFQKWQNVIQKIRFWLIWLEKGLGGAMDDNLKAKHFLCYVTKVNTGSGNDLVPDSTKSLPEPMLIKLYNITYYHQGSMS